MLILGYRKRTLILGEWISAGQKHDKRSGFRLMGPLMINCMNGYERQWLGIHERICKSLIKNSNLENQRSRELID